MVSPINIIFLIFLAMLMWLVKFIQTKFSDKTILTGRVLFGLVYVGLMSYNLIYLGKPLESDYLFWLIHLEESQLLIAKYALTAIGLMPIFMGLTNLCLMQKKYVKRLQIFMGFLLFYIAGAIKDSASLDFDIIIGLMGIFPIFMGITGKCITSKCMKYNEKITKIRV